MKVGWLSAGAVCALSALAAGCKKSSGAGAAENDGSTDAATERGPVLCSELDGGAGTAGDGSRAAGSETTSDADAVDGGALALGGSTTDEFGPNTAASKTTSSLGRVNFYEVTTPSVLERVDIYLRAGLDHTRLTLAVHESTGRDSAFKKVFEVQIDFAMCEGWASSSGLSIPLQAGHFYAVGFDPNQAITPFVSADADSIPIDGAFGRLIGSKTSTSVSIDTLTWDKFSDKEYNRQRLTTAPRPVSDAGADDASASDSSGGDAGSDGPADARATIDAATKS